MKNASSSAATRSSSVFAPSAARSIAPSSQVVGRADLEPLRPGLATFPADVAAEHLGFDAQRSSARFARPSGPRNAAAKAGASSKAANVSMKPCDLPQQIIEFEGAGVARHAFQRRQTNEFLADAIASSRASSMSAAASRSSITLKCAGTFASKGKSCRSLSQKA